MASACASSGSAVANQTVTHDGDPRLARHITARSSRRHPEGAYITKEHRHSSRKIDLATAAVIAYDRATTRGRKAASIYETRGLFVIGDDLDDDWLYDKDDDAPYDEDEAS